MTINKEKLKEIIKENKNNLKTFEDVNELLREISKQVMETLLDGEMEQHLGYAKYDYKNKQTENARNGYSEKQVESKLGSIELSVPRDRQGEFEPVVVKKRQKQLSGLEDKIISMYGRGMTTRDIQDHIMDIYNYEMSAETISNMTDSIIEKAKQWQNRPLEEIYTIVYLDALYYKVRSEGKTVNKALYIILGIDIGGKKDILGMWVGQNESSKFWLGILNEIRNRGVKDILIMSVDGLTGLQEAIQAVYPRTEVQLCVIHQIRNSMRYASYKDRQEVVDDLKEIYKADTEEAGKIGLKKFRTKWDKKYLYIGKSWEKNWEALATFYKYPEEIKRMIYTTNAIESLNRGLRKVTKSRSLFPNDEALIKLLYLAAQNIMKKWQRSATVNWPLILSQLVIMFDDRLENYV